MNKKLIKLTLIGLAFFIILLLGSVTSNANTVTKLQKAIQLNEDGSAKVAEIWDIEADSKTEIYVPWSNLGNSEFKDLKVSDDRGVTYETLISWNADGTFEDKKNKCGINKTSSGIEICWGISEYGTRRYKVRYDITNYVEECKDSQYVYWQVFPKNFGLTVNSINVRIQSDKGFSKDNTKIWSFGYPNGTIELKDGYIYMDSNGTLPSSNYMKMLIKFEDNMFNVANKNNKTFQNIYDEAMIGTENEKPKDEQLEKSLKIFSITWIVIIGLLILATIISIIKAIKKWIKTPIRKYGIVYEGGKSMPSNKEVAYVRDLSQIEENLDEVYYILLLYGMIETKDKSIIMGAILLKWIKKELITITNAKSGIFDFMNQKYCIDLSRITEEMLENETEKDLYRILSKAAGMDKMLEPKEFKTYCKSNSKKVLNFFSSVKTRANEGLREKGEIVDRRQEYKKIVRKVIQNDTVYTAELKEKAIKLLGLKKFLLDYSKIAEREAIEVELWDKYLVYAQLLGIADKVEKQFNSIYPNYQTILNINEAEANAEKLLSSITYAYADAGLDMAEKWHQKELVRAARAARWASSSSDSGFSSYSHSSDSSRDYGGGGSSYSGGGSGSSGSSSGGGAR